MIDRFAASTRRFTARHRRWYWPLVASAAALSIIAVQQRANAYEQQRASWGDTLTVLVASSPIQPGDPIGEHVETIEVPRALAPADAWDSAGGIAQQHVDVGSVLTEVDVAVGDDPLALVPDGWVAVAVVESISSGAAIGEAVGVISSGMRIVERATVIELRDDGAVLAVPADAAGLLATANDNRSLTLVRLTE